MPAALTSSTSASHSGYCSVSSCQVHQRRSPRSALRTPVQSCSHTADSSAPSASRSSTAWRTFSVPPWMPRTAPSSTQSASAGRSTPDPRRSTSAAGERSAVSRAVISGPHVVTVTDSSSRVSATANACEDASAGSRSSPRRSPVTNEGQAAYVMASVPPAPRLVTSARKVRGCSPRPTPCSRMISGMTRPDRSKGANCSPNPCTPAPGVRPEERPSASSAVPRRDSRTSPATGPSRTSMVYSRFWPHPLSTPEICRRPPSSVAERTSWSASSHSCRVSAQKYPRYSVTSTSPRTPTTKARSGGDSHTTRPSRASSVSRNPVGSRVTDTVPTCHSPRAGSATVSRPGRTLCTSSRGTWSSTQTAPSPAMSTRTSPATPSRRPHTSAHHAAPGPAKRNKGGRCRR